jgi:hypothetical protein
LPKLKKLSIYFIGDEALLSDFPREFSYKGKDLQNGRENLEVVYHMAPPQMYQGRDSPISKNYS